ncbi:MAG: hypothetical protein DLM67_08915 [Candidatus Nephthysia bennettiae]|uniref:FAD-dependent oxidoreductase n=1 Tax=Candidatus Nephthysia bennettiae TaxID=3127016 RepID=A0A934JY13_9BACT|nr:FAD-dependent oxidoreductase [Candidatus Dormibacteraeota bacterium]MBJ7613658.1 FAD-dependent oxidoreductase [Candidatus Dormibacteraeota bacterium]PZR97044.1 MAG: hypothetical protein DLM67_08915 [Candidatus Dormibacteraeota bacterium]
MGSHYDLVVVGVGSAGLVAAEFAHQIDLKAIAVEGSRVGGDCLWTGCIPSKSLLASARVAHLMRTADRFGITSREPEIETERVWARIHDIQRRIAETDDNPDRFREASIEVPVGEPARLIAPHSVSVGDRTLDTRYVLICTGSRPAAPAIPGLEEAGFITSENVFDLKRAPRSLIFIGGGPIAMELAQGMKRLGVGTEILQSGDRVLPRDEPELSAILTDVIRSEGVGVHLGVQIDRVTVENGEKVVHARVGGSSQSWRAEEIFVATGRRPNVEGLGLEELGIEVGKRGIEVDSRLRTAVKNVYAAGDVAGRYLFTHSAAYEAVQALRDMFYPGRGSAPKSVPWCTFTDPELAHAGMTIAEARAAHGDIEVWRWPLDHCDRARADGATDGAIVLVSAKKRLVGAHILAPAAGEMIHELALAIHRGLKISDVYGMVHVYPTYATSIGQVLAAAAYQRARDLKWLVRSAG